MTTLVSLASRDFIVVGCDSLATQSMQLVRPRQFVGQFFNPDGSLKVDAHGQPLLNDSSQVWLSSQSFPVNQLPSVTKIFDLKPKKAALLFAGAARIKELTVKNLVESFKDTEPFTACNGSYTMADLADRLKTFMVKNFVDQYPDERERPSMDIILSGYSSGSREPEVYRLTFGYDFHTTTFSSDVVEEVSRGKYDVVYGGQYDVIQRVVSGVDLASWHSLKMKCFRLLEEHRQQIQAELNSAGVTFSISALDFNDPKHDLFSSDFGGVEGLALDVGGLSEQAGIDFVTFLIKTMIKAQEFATSIPTVGGDVHLGIITSSEGFRWLSKEEYKFEGYSIPKFHDHA